MPMFLFSGTFYPIDAYRRRSRRSSRRPALSRRPSDPSMTTGTPDATLLVDLVYLVAMGRSVWRSPRGGWRSFSVIDSPAHGAAGTRGRRRTGSPLARLESARPARLVSFARMATERSYYEILGVERSASDAEIKPLFASSLTVAPRRQRRCRGRRQVQRDKRGISVLSDPKAAPDLRHVGRAGLGDMGAGSPFGEGFGGSAISSMPSSPAWAAPRPAPGGAGINPLRPALRHPRHLRGGGSGIEKEIEFDVLTGAPPAAGLGRARQRPVTCSACGARRDSERSPDHARAAGERHGLQSLQRRGPYYRVAMHRLPRRGAPVTAQEDPGHDPAGIDEGHQIRLSGEGEAGPRGGPAATCTWPYT